MQTCFVLRILTTMTSVAIGDIGTHLSVWATIPDLVAEIGRMRGYPVRKTERREGKAALVEKLRALKISAASSPSSAADDAALASDFQALFNDVPPSVTPVWDADAVYTDADAESDFKENVVLRGQLEQCNRDVASNVVALRKFSDANQKLLKTNARLKSDHARIVSASDIVRQRLATVLRERGEARANAEALGARLVFAIDFIARQTEYLDAFKAAAQSAGLSSIPVYVNHLYQQ